VRIPDLLEAITAESTRFHAALASAELAATVPTCPDWSAADLAWHLGQVQGFWASIVDDLVTDPGSVVRPPRPPDGELLDFFSEQAARLSAALRSRSATPEARCWSWHEQGQSVGWVIRRQAHEALIHRVDAELVAGAHVTDTDPALGADGFDELLHLATTGVPDEFVSDGTTIAVECTDAPSRWALELGSLRATSRGSSDGGEQHDRPAARISHEGGDPAAVVEGRAWDLDRWLWGRETDAVLRISGDAALAPRLRAVAER
jgi:uncharacterized protein (TIGR03083 family)